MKKKVILPPARAPMSLDECAESFEKTARLLKQMKEKGINSEDRTKTAIAELTGERGHPPPKLVTEQEYEIVKRIQASSGLSEYDACRAYETILAVVSEALASGVKVKLNRFGIFKKDDSPKGPTVRYKPSAVLLQEVNW